MRYVRDGMDFKSEVRDGLVIKKSDVRDGLVIKRVTL